MLRLCQKIAVLKGLKSRSKEAITEHYKALGRAQNFFGLIRTYQPYDDEGENLPPENKKIVDSVEERLTAAAVVWSDLIDGVAVVDVGNRFAGAPIVVDGVEIADDVPVPTLLFLEKQLQDVRTFLEAIPTNPREEEWTYVPGNGEYESAPKQTTRGKKVPRNHVLSQATPEHPAQVEVFTEDVNVGLWTSKQVSKAMTESDKNQMLERCGKLLTAVKEAREIANSVEVPQIRIGAGIIGFVTG